MRDMKAKYILGALLIILIASCGRTPLNPTLVELEKMADAMPEVALDSLHRISKEDLSRADKVYYDFLSVKLADKAFIRHTSDSLIISVINYYSRHGIKDRYAEVLYYGGRVYHDIGDFPSAIEYYGEALNQIEGNKESLKLKGTIVSQMSSLLNAMRLFNEARRYISMAIEVDKKLNDTVNLMYDLEVLGLNLMNSRNYDAAEQLFRKALNISNKKHHDAALWDSAHIAAVKNYKTETDSAVRFIKNIPHKVMNVDKYDNDTRQLVYSYAADIYRCAGMPDSAYKYALELVKIKDAKNLKKGYAILLSDELKDLVPNDSIRAYVRHYKNAVESYMNSRGMRMR